MPADLPQAAAGLGGRTCGADMLLFQKKGVVVDPYRGFGGGQVAPQPRLGKRPLGAQQLQLQLAKEDLQQKTTRSEGPVWGGPASHDGPQPGQSRPRHVRRVPKV